MKIRESTVEGIVKNIDGATDDMVASLDPSIENDAKDYEAKTKSVGYLVDARNALVNAELDAARKDKELKLREEELEFNKRKLQLEEERAKVDRKVRIISSIGSISAMIGLHLFDWHGEQVGFLSGAAAKDNYQKLTKFLSEKMKL